MKTYIHAIKKVVIKATISLFLLSIVSSVYGANDKIVGSAYSVKTGSLLYRETHTRQSEVRHSVEYTEPDGFVFGQKTIDFSQSLIVPSFYQLNERQGEEIRVTQDMEEMIVHYTVKTGSKQKSKRIKIAKDLVADAGFDGFIKRHWAALELGKTLDVDYLVPTQRDTFAFRFSRANCLEGTPNGALCFSLSPLSWLVKLAVDPIVVAYSSADKRLLRFTGRGNIANASGKYENVDIRYEYF